MNHVDSQFLNQTRYTWGIWFNPTDEELIVYLKKKIDNKPIADVCIFDVEFYKFNPWELTATYEIYPTLARDEWYFYTSREHRYLNGSRPNRAAGDGFWKATVADKRIYHNNECVGFKKTLVFHQGKGANGKKTNWIMHEYTVKQPPTPTNNDNMRLDDCVLCRIHESKQASPKFSRSIAEYETLEDIQHFLLDDFDLITTGDQPDDSLIDNQLINGSVDELIKTCM